MLEIQNQRRIKRPKLKPPRLDKEEFRALFKLLHKVVGTEAKIARALGVDRRTVRKWHKEPPEWGWWNVILRDLIAHSIAILRARKKSITRKWGFNIMHELHIIPRGEKLLADIEDLLYDYSASEIHLRQLLTKNGSMLVSEIMLSGHNGSYTRQMLHNAAVSLGVVREQVGFGKDKDSLWRLPREEDVPAPDYIAMTEVKTLRER